MATRDVAGRRYALAILDIARDAGDMDGWLAAVDVLEALTAESRFVDSLQADGLSDERFQAIVRRVLPDATPVQMNLFRLLRRKSRLSLGPSVASYYRELVDAERGILRAVVTTAVELDDDRVRQIRERIAGDTGRQVEVEATVDPSILGGMTVRIGDQLLDGSTVTRLRRLRGQLEQVSV